MQISHQALQKQSKEIKGLVCSSQHPTAIKQDKIGEKKERKKERSSNVDKFLKVRPQLRFRNIKLQKHESRVHQLRKH